MQKPLGAQISHMLKDRGVDVIFGIPGVHNQEKYRGIEEAGITHVLARHEQGAGFMADGYARATGRPGVAYVISGPGLTNAMTPMGQAYSDSVPMLVMSSCLDEIAARKGQLHQMKDQRLAAETVCDWSEEARSATAAYELVDRAFGEFLHRRNRPKHIQVPIAALEAMADAPPPPFEGAQGHAHPAPANMQAVDELAKNLQAAKRPIFIFGGGAVAATEAARTVMQRTGAAAFVTYAGRGILTPDQPRFFGSTLARPGSAQVLAQADLVIAVGTELAEVDLWRHALGHTARIVRVDSDPVVLRDAQRAETQICGNASAVLDALLAALPPTVTHDWTDREVAEQRAKWRAEVMSERPGIVPVAEALRDCLPDGTMIYSDMTQFAYAAKEVWDMDRPGHWHHPTGFGTLGYAMPAAIGGAVARPGQPTMAIAGDYGFQYTLQELATAVEMKLPLPIFLWDNGKLKEIEDSMVAAQIQPNAVTVQNPHFVKLAEAYGAYGCAPTTLAEMQSEVTAAFGREGPTIIHVSAGIGL